MERLGWLAAGLAIALAVAAVAAASVMAAGAPSGVRTGAAKRTAEGFALNGKLNPDGSPTTYYFIYKEVGSAECEDLEGCGPETSKGTLTGDTEKRVQPKEATGLRTGKSYEYWLVARNAYGAAIGKRRTFTA